ncbi:hypothetical protein B0O99DRAFT_687050 [Bisporella sp. PMI_857]|nr:hypothetical protein B0O99DRAFT_687050 [Bisporella sp. PMI_857]
MLSNNRQQREILADRRMGCRLLATVRVRPALETAVVEALQTLSIQDSNYVPRQTTAKREEDRLMEHLKYFLQLGGIIQAVPVYRSDQPAGTTPLQGQIRIRKEEINQLILYNVHPELPGVLPQIPEQVQGDVWEWLFVDLHDEEAINDCILTKSRWIWMGQFGLGQQMDRDVPFPARSASSNPNITGPMLELESS